MSITDPIADMLSALKNASQVGKEEVVVPYSGFKEQLASLLKKEGFIAEVTKFKEKDGSRLFLAVKLIYDKGGSPKVQYVKRVSKPGRRVYVRVEGLKPPSAGVKIVSTSRGLMTDKEVRKRRLGGEVIAEVG